MKCAALVLGLLAAAPAQAQLAATDVNDEADDAFGVRIGVENVGIYSESNVRGFSLQDAGNYRIEGAYFVRSAAPANPVLTGSRTRVGISALRQDFPGPSGIVDFSLRRPAGGTNLYIESGTRAHSGPFAELNFDHGTADSRMSLVGGVHLYPWQRYADGSRGEFLSAGLAPTWRSGKTLSITALATGTSWATQADTGFSVPGDALPKAPRAGVFRGQDWARFRNSSTTFGAILVARPGKGWRLKTSLFRSSVATDRSDFNLYAVEDPRGRARLTAFLVPENRSRSWAGEVLVSREWRRGGADHHVVAMARLRDSLNEVRSGVPVALGEADIFAPTQVPDPGAPPEGAALSDRIDQSALGLGYRLRLGTRLELRADVQRARYAKAIGDGEVPTRRVSSPWLYSGSITLGATPDLAIFASYTRGLEESGIAPNNASNRNEVLPPVIAEQAEAGLRHALSDELTLIANLFEIRKDVPALGADGVFGLIGQARHRGVELSVSGRASDAVTLVFGGLYLDATLSGEQVANGTVGRRSVGRPEAIGFANISWRVPQLAGLALDASLNYQGREYVDRRNRLRTPGLATVNLGARYGFGPPDRPLTLRGRVVNLFDAGGWDATPSELLFPVRQRAVALSLTTTL